MSIKNKKALLGKITTTILLWIAFLLLAIAILGYVLAKFTGLI